MPVSPALADELAAEVLRAYMEAEEAMLARIARNLAKNLPAPDWAERKLAELQLVQAGMRGDLSRHARTAQGELARALVTGYNRGQAAGMSDVVTLAGGDPELAAELVTAGIPRVEALYAETVDSLQGVHSRVLREFDDVYRQVVRATTAGTVTGALTRREMAQQVLDRFAAAGVTGFTDRAGRRWQLSSYVEMATRSATARAAVQGHTDRLQAAGYDLVYVSNSPNECKACARWEGKVLSLSGTVNITPGVDVAGTVDQARRDGYGHPGCVIADTRVSVPTGLRASDSRWYQGDVIVIRTAGGEELTITPNHPVLTAEGWIPAGDVKVGQCVISYGPRVERVLGAGPGDEDVPARIGEIHHALREASTVPPMRVPSAPEQFHGDGEGSDVEVVLADGLLKDHLLPAGLDELGDAAFLVGGVRLPLLLGGGPLLDLGERQDAPNGRLMGGRGEVGSLLGGQPLHPPGGGSTGVGVVAAPQQRLTDRRLGAPDVLGDDRLGDSGLVHLDRFGDPCQLGALSHLAGLPTGTGDPECLESLVDCCRADASIGSEVDDPRAGRVALAEIVKVERREFAGHVYNLQSGGGWYTASTIVVHNCTHSLSLYLPGVTDLPKAGTTANPEGYEAKEKLRYLERQVRASKRVEAVALDDRAAAKARARTREYQAKIRDHVATTSAKRQPGRESITHR